MRELTPHSSHNEASPLLSMEMPAESENLTVVRQAISAIGEFERWNAALLADVKLAVSEACTNVVAHAHPGERSGTMQVDLSVDGKELTVEVLDQGVGMESQREAPSRGLGLGIPLIHILAREVDISSDSEAGTHVTMRFDVAHGEVEV